MRYRRAITQKLRESPARLLLWIGSILLLAALAMLLIAYSGIYNVAASKGHVVWVKKLLELGMQRSVQTWSVTAPEPPRDLDSLSRVQLGASHFAGGCADCHGAPGSPVNAVHEGMLPPPPKLQYVVRNWTAEQLFWIVRHGIKYTGMPEWSGAGRDDEVWSIVAFLLQLPDLDSQSYQEFIAGNSRARNVRTSQSVAVGFVPDHLTTCNRCHDTPDAEPVSNLVPRLAGQSEQYLIQALGAYLRNERQSGIMEPVATALKEDEIRELAHYYFTLDSPRVRQLPDADQSLFAKGRSLAQQGDVARQVPACDACHADGTHPLYPRLAGQSAAYIEAQLALWRRGGRAQTATGRLMADIAQRLTAEQAREIATYYQQATSAQSGRESQ